MLRVCTAPGSPISLANICRGFRGQRATKPGSRKDRGARGTWMSHRSHRCVPGAVWSAAQSPAEPLAPRMLSLLPVIRIGEVSGEGRSGEQHVGRGEAEERGLGCNMDIAEGCCASSAPCWHVVPLESEEQAPGRGGQSFSKWELPAAPGLL